MIQKKEQIYIKNILMLSMGSILAQMCNLLSQPILTRCLSPIVIGQYTYLLSLANIVIPVASLKVDMLIINEEDELRAQYITDVCFGLVFASSICFGTVLYLSSKFGNGKLHDDGTWLWLTVLVVAAEGIRYICVSYSNRYKQYKMISQLSIVREGSKAAVQILDSLTSKTIIGQMMGNIIAPLLGTQKQLIEYRKRLKSRKKITREQIIDILRSSKKQILFIAPSQFLNTLAYSLFTFSVADLFTAEELGFYAISLKILGIPMIYITVNVSKVMFKRIGETIQKNEKTYEIVFRNVVSMAVISGIGFSVLYIIAPKSCELIFGSEYYISGVYIRCLIGMFMVRFIANSMAGLFTVYHKQSLELIFNLFLVCSAVVVYAISKTYGFSILTYLKTAGFGSSLVYFIQILTYLTVAKKHDLEVYNVNVSK